MEHLKFINNKYCTVSHRKVFIKYFQMTAPFDSINSSQLPQHSMNDHNKVKFTAGISNGVPYNLV